MDFARGFLAMHLIICALQSCLSVSGFIGVCELQRNCLGEVPCWRLGESS